MRLRSSCGLVAAVITLDALVISACGRQVHPPGSAARTSTSEPEITSCGIVVCATTPLTSPSSTGNTVPVPVTAAWVYATANLAGLPSECGNMSLLSARPDRDTVIAGVAREGLWASDKGSTTWTRMGQGNGSARILNRPSSITYDPSHPSTFWESGLYNGGGLYQTVDNGITFRPVGDLIHTDLVGVDLSDPARRTLLSGRHETSNLYRSTDGGATWVDLSSKLPTGIGFTTSPLVVNSNLHLLGTATAPGSGVFRTTNGGATWSRVYQGGVSGPALVAKSDRSIYWLLERGNGLIRSTDAGLSWQVVLGPGQISFASASLIELPDGRLATFGATVIVSGDHGVTWQPVGAPLPYTPTGLIYAPARKAFYAWRFDCVFTGDSSVKPDAIVRLQYDYKTQ